MPVKLYYLPLSPPARAVHVLLKHLNIPYELITVDVYGGQLNSEDYLKMNPQHTIPVLVDEDGFIVCDSQYESDWRTRYLMDRLIPEIRNQSNYFCAYSHAINAYLVNKYAKDDKLYPKELKARSIVDHRLFFDCGVLFQCLITISRGFFNKSITGMTQALVDRFIDAYTSLERYLTSTKYIAGDHVTIADFSVLTNLSNMQFFVPVDKERFPKLTAYIQRGHATIPTLEEIDKSVLSSMKERFRDFN